MPGPVTNSSDSRRGFLRLTAGLILGCSADLGIRSLTLEVAESSSLSLNAWLRIGTDNTVTIVVSQAEMGQGIMSTLPAVLAEEPGRT